ncbi:MAG TPA: hypothetical protein VFL97_09555 [Nitrococcus sp.]|nr:hypothetical protein [Nitrococcus sp.]
MSATPEMRHCRRQALAHLAALRCDLNETLHTEPSAPNPSLDVGRAWAELLCLPPALSACMRNLNAALGEDGSLMPWVRELDQLGSELCRLRLRAIRSTGAGSSELNAASKATVEALLACLTEWAKAAARTEKTDQPPRLAVAYPSQPKPPGHGINDIAGSYLRRNDQREDRCCITGLILAFALGVSLGGD